MGAVAGMITAKLDFDKLRRGDDGEDRTGEKAVLIIRIGVGVFNTATGAAAAWLAEARHLVGF